MRNTAGGGAAIAATTTAYLPLHVQAAILLRLPSFHLRRLRRVCKHWRDVIDDAQKRRRPRAPTHTIAFFRGCSAGEGVTAMLGHGFLFDEQWRLTARFTVDQSARLLGTCNSLLCFLLKYDIRVVDPLSGASIDVPLSPARHGSRTDSEYCFGFDPTTRQYKIVHVQGYTPNSLPSKDGVPVEKELHVYTVGAAGNGWRAVRIDTMLHGLPYKHDGIVKKDPACGDGDGAVYWLGIAADGTCKNARFDLATEEITSVDDRLINGQMPATEISCIYHGAKKVLYAIKISWFGQWQDGCWPRNITALPHNVTGVFYSRSESEARPSSLCRHLPGAQALQRGHLLLQEPGGTLYAHEVGSSSACMKELRLVGKKKKPLVAVGRIEEEPAEWYKFVPVRRRRRQTGEVEDVPMVARVPYYNELHFLSTFAYTPTLPHAGSPY